MGLYRDDLWYYILFNSFLVKCQQNSLLHVDYTTLYLICLTNVCKMYIIFFNKNKNKHSKQLCQRVAPHFWLHAPQKMSNINVFLNNLTIPVLYKCNM